MSRVLLIEDDPAISDMLNMTLSLSGFSVESTDCLAEAAQLLLEESFSIAVLDLTLKDGDGLDFIPRCLDRNLPVLVLTADGSLHRKIKSLNLGADDYMVKPFESLELIARLQAIMRRTENRIDQVEIGCATIDLDRRKVTENDCEILLTSQEWNLLTYLINNRGYVLNRDQLLQNVWGYDFPGNSRTVDMHIQKLRKKLNTTQITTVYKEGYRLEL